MTNLEDAVCNKNILKCIPQTEKNRHTYLQHKSIPSPKNNQSLIGKNINYPEHFLLRQMVKKDL